MSNCCSHGTLLRLGLQSAHFNVCTYPCPTLSSRLSGVQASIWPPLASNCPPTHDTRRFSWHGYGRTPPYELRTLSSGTSMLIWAITSSNPGLCPAFPGFQNSKKDRSFLLYFMFLRGLRARRPFWPPELADNFIPLLSMRITFRSSQCLSHFAAPFVVVRV